MPATYEIEFADPKPSRCDCCNGLNVRLTRFVYRNGDAFAIYYVAYANNHPEDEVSMLVSLGDWDDDSDPAERAAFYCRVRPTEESYEVMLGDAAQSMWSDVELVGQKLSREQALAHPWKQTAFEILDEAFIHDKSLTGFLHRVQCGDASVPLEKSFLAPDEIFALGKQRDERAELHRNFASLDGERFFIRSLLPIPVEGYDRWCIGLWIEVSKADYDRAWDTWGDTEKYAALRFSGTIANDVGTDLNPPIVPGANVNVHVVDAESSPMIETPSTGKLADLMSSTWNQIEFEEYVVARGFL